LPKGCRLYTFWCVKGGLGKAASELKEKQILWGQTAPGKKGWLASPLPPGSTYEFTVPQNMQKILKYHNRRAGFSFSDRFISVLTYPEDPDGAKPRKNKSEALETNRPDLIFIFNDSNLLKGISMLRQAARSLWRSGAASSRGVCTSVASLQEATDKSKEVC